MTKKLNFIILSQTAFQASDGWNKHHHHLLQLWIQKDTNEPDQQLLQFICWLIWIDESVELAHFCLFLHLIIYISYFFVFFTANQQRSHSNFYFHRTVWLTGPGEWLGITSVSLSLQPMTQSSLSSSGPLPFPPLLGVIWIKSGARWTNKERKNIKVVLKSWERRGWNF